MSDGVNLSGFYRRLPLLLTFVLSAYATSYAYIAFADQEPVGRGLPLCIGLMLVAVAVVEVLSGGMAFMPRELGRELAGFGGLVCVFVSLMALVQLNQLGPNIRGWELVIGCAASYAFFLHSQRSFLMMASLQAFLMLAALMFRESIAAACVFVGLLIALAAILFHRERIEETSATGRPINPRLPLRPLPACLALVVALNVFFWGLRPAQLESYADIVRRGRPDQARRTVIIGSVLDQMMPTDEMIDPFAKWTVPGLPPAPGAEEVAQTGLAFQRDLKFGDLPSGGGHPETVVMYVRLEDAGGGARRGEGLPLFWKTGAVYRCERSEWTGDPTPGRVVEDADDGATDGAVTMRAEEPRCRVDTVVQRVILWPQPTRSLFALYPPESIDTAPLHVDGEGMLSRVKRFDGRFKYSVRARVPVPTERELAAAAVGAADGRYLQLPAAFAKDPVFDKLASEVYAAGRTPHERARAAVTRLETFNYSVNPRLPADQDPTLAFLKSRRGYCQHFASALCALLRRCGVPARIGVGFTSGDWDGARDVFVVRRKHAHAWVEAHYDGIGWVPYDAATGPTNRFVAGGEAPDPVPVEPRTAEPPLDPPKTAQPPPDPPKTGTPPPPDPPKTSDPPSLPDPPKTAPPPPAPPAPPPKGDGTVPDEVPKEHEFDKLWDAIDNKLSAKSAAGAGGAAGAANPTSSGGKGAAPGSPEAEAAAQGPISRLGGAAARVVWTILRDLLIILAAAAIIVAIVASVIRLRGLRRAPEKEGGVVAEERYLDEEPLEEVTAPRVGGKPSNRRRIVEIYGELLAWLARAGLGRAPAQTAAEYAAYLGERLAPVPSGVHRLTDLFVRARYGGEDRPGDEVTRAQEAMREATAEIKRTRK